MKRRFFTLMLLGFLLILDFSGWQQHLQAQTAFSPYSGEIQGEMAYQEGKWSDAQFQWEQSLESYEKNKDLLGEVRVLGKLALVYAYLGQWEQVEQIILQGETLLPQLSDPQTQAQFYNNLGNVVLMRGKTQKALNYWQEAENLFKKAQDSQGIFLSQVNQAKALKSLGLFSSSCQKLLESLNFTVDRCANLTLDDLEDTLAQISEPLEEAKLSGWLTLADILRKLGKFNESLTILATIQPFIPETIPQGSLWLSAGKTLQLQGETQTAAEAYQKTLNEDSSLLTQIEAQLLQINLFLNQNPPKIDAAITLISGIEQKLSRLPVSQSQLDTTFNYIYQLLRLKELNLNDSQLPSWEAISTLTENSLNQAQKLEDQRLMSYGMGLLGKIKEKQQQWSSAKAFTNQALILAESLNAKEIVYLWQWQLGRILAQENQKEEAIEAYRRAINIHRQISGEIAANREAQFSFQETGENLYREAVSLLLQSSDTGDIPQSNLIEARKVMESLQIATLNNFFRDNCLESPELIDNISNTDPNTAVFYPIIFKDRLGVILSLPEQPLEYYESQVSENKLKQTLEKFRDTVVIRSLWDFLDSGAQIYDWLIRPVLPKLEKMGIKTLIFVPDEGFRNIPLSSLVSDPIKRHYLIEQYQVAITPSLSLFPSIEGNLTPLSLLLGGITLEQMGTISLPYVATEIKNIKPFIDKSSIILENEALNLENLETAFRKATFPIVHLATHGVFSSSFEDTYLLIWQNILNIQQLGNLLEISRLQKNQAIELLVLSACETATGDQRAALGLAGMAVRSGARSTLATLWSVNDEGTAYFMGEFYKNLADKEKQLSKVATLQAAQLKLIQDQWYNHPFYWSSFVLVGNWQ